VKIRRGARWRTADVNKKTEGGKKEGREITKHGA